MKRMIVIAACLVFTLGIAAFAYDPAPFDIVMQSGEDYRLSLTFSNISGHAINLIGYTYAAQVRATPQSAVMANFSTIITDAPNGRLDVRMSRGTTSRIAGKSGMWDLKQTDAGGLVSYPMRGKVLIQQSVTQ